MNKTKFIFFLISVLGIVSLLTYLNYDKILNYFTNKEWQIADSVGKIELGDYIDTCGTSSNFFVVKSDAVEGYSETAKKSFEKSIDNKEIVVHTNADYCIIAEKGATNVTVFSGNEIVWNTTISNASIMGAGINKNGYSAIIYSQTGYKSLIKVFSNTGVELFTNYLASTYALDVAISNDNKYLAIAEIDTNGINVESQIKIINIEEASESNIKKYELDSDELITDIEYNESNDLVIMTDSNVKLLKDESLKKVVDYAVDNVLFADISNRKNAIVVQNKKNGLFDENVQVCIYNFDLEKEPEIYELEDIPNGIKCMKNIIAIDTGAEIIFLNTSGNFVKKCEYKGQLKDLKLFNDGNTAVLIFRDEADFIKVGGI